LTPSPYSILTASQVMPICKWARITLRETKVYLKTPLPPCNSLPDCICVCFSSQRCHYSLCSSNFNATLLCMCYSLFFALSSEFGLTCDLKPPQSSSLLPQCSISPRLLELHLDTLHVLGRQILYSELISILHK
jgi:hypothetical protein